MIRQLIKVVTVLLILLTGGMIFPQQKSIRIIANCEEMPKGSDIYIAGNTDQMGNWNEMLVMKKESASEWSFYATAEAGDTLQFKFTRGSWRTEAVDSNGMEYPNFLHAVNKDTTLVYLIPGWRDVAQQKIIISKERLENKAGMIELLEGWKYKIGDSPVWADTAFNDKDWEIINPTLAAEDFEKLDWTGNVWFRNLVIVDSSLWNKPLGLIFSCTGAAELFLNGKSIYKYGDPGNSNADEISYIDRTPRQIVFDEKEKHLIAVRYSNFVADEIIKYDIFVGFYAVIGDLNMFISNRIDSVRERSVIQMAFSAFILAFSIIHLLLFVFYPKARENLFYSISMFSFAIVIYFSIQGEFTNSILVAIEFGIINSVAVQTAIFFGLLTVYASTYTKMPKQFIFFTILWALFALQTLFFPTLGGEYTEYAFYVYSLILSLEIIRVVIRSLIKKEPWGWGWIIGIGFLIAFISIVYQVLIIIEVVRPLFGIYLVYVYGIVFLAITVSINLSKKVADTNKNLENQLIQVKELSKKTIEQERKVKEEELARRLLEADNKRKTLELEEARKLQLSMLPMKVPDVPDLDIAVFMKPATEVGGDYYDFKYNNNGALTIAVGDATGHGMKAGTMVATIKGLFTAEDMETDIELFLDKSNLIIRDMHLGNLFMAMMMVKIHRKTATFSSAGMPPPFLFRQASREVEEIRLPALPLGGSADFKYKKTEIILSQGDTLLLMSDGFPELFNESKEMLDYKKAKTIFGNVAELSSKQVIDRLCEEADNWRGNAKLEDDITFVVVKVK